MKRFLHKKWHRLPVALTLAVLLVCLTAGSAFAAFSVWNQTYTVTVEEPIEVTVSHEPEANVEPGLGYIGLILRIHNTGGAPLPITVTWTCNDIGDIVFSNYGAGYCDETGAVFTDPDTGKGAMNLNLDETFTIYSDDYAPSGKSSYVVVQFQQLVPADCPSGEATIDVSVDRG